MTGRLAYGIQLPVQSQSRIYVEPWELDAGPRELVEVARAADEAGFAYVACCDHVAIPRRLADAMGTVWYDPVATLAHLAAVTTRVRLLSHVAIAGLRHPLLTAKQYATLDHLSGGRLILGVGAGHVQEEFEALGVDFARRGAVLDETLDALRTALGPDEFTGHHGTLYDYDDLGQRPRPAQPRVPVWVGGSSPAAIRRAALKGDGWLPQGDPRDRLPAQIEAIRQLRGDMSEFTVGAIAEPLYVGTPDWDVGRRTLTGSPAELADSLNAYGQWGVGQIQVRFRSRSVGELADQIRKFGVEVAPLLGSVRHLS
ncbi:MULTISPECIES: LLM class F420-dependent oxidoreductase [unclassified Streptomyces]|uniref:LLM class F420-dependent oxidoreductase n=1 Tax=unclassified Streptomyces TaxID=2593676 RepID=UPI000DD99F0D|nr:MULTISPECIES: LLM class F420-dependent oxidoreductase [unclassified Streptomyces]QZZ32774.1 LLM class F420-dependent oxidoreductase [Streptomyces sp. ST1015]